MSKKRILCTGDHGFIGTNLKRVLGKEYKVIGWDLQNEKDIFDRDFELYVKDIDVVIHLAALTNVNQSFEERNNVFYTNVLGTARVAELCAKYGKKLIYPSSAAIIHPELSPYAHSKAVAEEIVNGIMEMTPTVILRLYNVYGDNMNPHSESVMYNFLVSEQLKVFGDGEQTRDYVNVEDVVLIMKDAIENEKWNGNIVEVGMGEAISTNTVAGLFAYYQGKKIVYEAPRREIKWSIANTAMLRALYKKPMVSSLSHDIKQLCRKYVVN